MTEEAFELVLKKLDLHVSLISIKNIFKNSFGIRIYHFKGAWDLNIYFL